MGSIAISIPVEAGGAEKLKDHLDGFIHGPHGQARHDHMVDLGFTHARVYHQKLPVESVIFYIEGPEVHDALHKAAGHEHDISKDFFKLVEAISGHGDWHKELPEMLLDWHHQEGHKHKPAKRK